MRRRRDAHTPNEAAARRQDAERTAVERRRDDSAERLLDVVRTNGNARQTKDASVAQRLHPQRAVLPARDERLAGRERDVLRWRVCRQALPQRMRPSG